MKNCARNNRACKSDKTKFCQERALQKIRPYPSRWKVVLTGPPPLSRIFEMFESSSAFLPAVLEKLNRPALECASEISTRSALPTSENPAPFSYEVSQLIRLKSFLVRTMLKCCPLAKEFVLSSGATAAPPCTYIPATGPKRISCRFARGSQSKLCPQLPTLVLRST